jgi:hypothetical protein
MRVLIAKCFGVFLAVSLLCGPAHPFVQMAAAAQVPRHHCPEMNGPEMNAMAAHGSGAADHGQTGKDRHSAVPPCCLGASVVIAIAADFSRIAVPAFGSTIVAYQAPNLTVSGLTPPPDLDPPRSIA